MEPQAHRADEEDQPVPPLPSDHIDVIAQRVREPRVWRGVPRDKRVQERHARLLEAGLEVFGTVGARHATVGAVCQEARLTQRYFYESFPNLKYLLAEVFTVITQRQHDRMAEAALRARADGGDLVEAAEAALTVYFGGLHDDHRGARVQLLEILGADERTDRCYQAAIRRAADLVLVMGEWRGMAQPAVPRLVALGLIGAVVEISTMWFLSDFADPLDAVVGSAVAVFSAVISSGFSSVPT